MYTFYRVRKLRTEERLAAMQRGVNIPMEPELSESARSRRAGILLMAGAVGYMVAFTIVARVEPDALMAAAFGAIPFALGLGYFLDSALIRRDARDVVARERRAVRCVPRSMTARLEFLEWSACWIPSIRQSGTCTALHSAAPRSTFLDAPAAIPKT